ncbi:MAG: hypothetical protein LBV08_10505 [Clostridiales bacterium]|jgi:indole-3-glycerol phosphate synthase|nr:hypothetical protein [Clostridiales bacterium]
MRIVKLDILDIKTQKINRKPDGSYLYRIVKLLESHEPKPIPCLIEYFNSKGFSVIFELKKMDFYNDYIDDEFDLARYAEGMGKFCSAFYVVTEDCGLLGDTSFISRLYGLTKLPIIQRDVIVSPMQIIEAKKRGASAVCLIMPAMQREFLKNLIQQAELLKIGAITEAFDAGDIQGAVECGAKIISINLNVAYFDEHRIRSLFELIPKDVVSICHTYIDKFEDLMALKVIGFDGAVISNFYDKHQRGDIFRQISERVREL